MSRLALNRISSLFTSDVEYPLAMAGKWLEIAKKMVEGARAGLAIERKRLNEIIAERQRKQVPALGQRSR
ncbi:MAG TPA: hypothetical protein VNX26_15565 [Candidatus Acidoferrum sp.]|jgi:hypothetical protein|nr:hypothetical protein [Candidatus Acidoferrum sp.]